MPGHDSHTSSDQMRGELDQAQMLIAKVNISQDSVEQSEYVKACGGILLE